MAPFCPGWCCMTQDRDRFAVVVDHRSRTAAERRQRMRAHLIRAALDLVADHGMSSNLIDGLIRSAGVSRGTFYNYFSSAEELMEAVSTSASQSLIDNVDPVVQSLQCPAARVSCGIRLCLRAGVDDRRLAAFISRGGPAALHRNLPLATALRRDLAAGIDSGLFASQSLELAYDLVTGPVLAAYHRLSIEEASYAYVDDVACSVMMALGVKPSTARKLSTESLPALSLKPSIHTADDFVITSKRKKK